MSLIWGLIAWTVFGLIAGSIARLIVPGEQPIGFLKTVGLGILGSYVGGFVAWLFLRGSPIQPSGLVWSIIGATGILAFAVHRNKKA